MRAGELDRRITIQRSTPTQDSTGDPVKSWATLATVWARFEPVGTREAFQEGQERVAWADGKFVMRWRSDVTPTTKDQVIDTRTSRTFEILGVTEPIGTRLRTWELHCKAHVA